MGRCTSRESVPSAVEWCRADSLVGRGFEVDVFFGIRRRSVLVQELKSKAADRGVHPTPIPGTDRLVATEILRLTRTRRQAALKRVRGGGAFLLLSLLMVSWNYFFPGFLFHDLTVFE